MDFVGRGLPLSAAGLGTACSKLNVGAAEIWSIVFTETDYPYSGFWQNRSPQILYEQHIFHRLTNGRFDEVAPNISNPNPGNYNGDQYQRLNQAIALDETAALQSASWGIGQVLGENYKTVGYGSPQQMVDQMLTSEDTQLAAVVEEILAMDINRSLALHDWPNFARAYNGPNYAASGYDKHLSSWFAKFVSGALPDLRVRSAQILLMYLDYNPNVIDGIWGPRTAAAVSRFQTDNKLAVTGQIDDVTYQKLVDCNS